MCFLRFSTTASCRTASPSYTTLCPPIHNFASNALRKETPPTLSTVPMPSCCRCFFVAYFAFFRDPDPQFIHSSLQHCQNKILFKFFSFPGCCRCCHPFSPFHSQLNRRHSGFGENFSRKKNNFQFPGSLPSVLPAGLPGHRRSRTSKDEQRHHCGPEADQRCGISCRQYEEGPGPLLRADAVHLRAG